MANPSTTYFPQTGDLAVDALTTGYKWVLDPSRIVDCSISMRQKSFTPSSPSERLVKNIRRATRRHHSAEEKIRIVLDGLWGESSLAELCRREGIAEGLNLSQII